MKILLWIDKNLHFTADKAEAYSRKCSTLDLTAGR